jgi:hypothetical protein
MNTMSVLAACFVCMILHSVNLLPCLCAGLPAATSAACYSMSARLRSLQQQQQQRGGQQQELNDQLQIISKLCLLLVDICLILTQKDSALFNSSNLTVVYCAAAGMLLPLLLAACHPCSAADVYIDSVNRQIRAITYDLPEMQSLERQQQLAAVAATAGSRQEGTCTETDPNTISSSPQRKLAHSQGLTELLVAHLAIMAVGLRVRIIHGSSSSSSSGGGVGGGVSSTVSRLASQLLQALGLAEAELLWCRWRQTRLAILQMQKHMRRSLKCSRSAVCSFTSLCQPT